jgi:hypothetical protein
MDNINVKQTTMKYNTALHNYFNQHKNLNKLFNEMNDIDIEIDPLHNKKLYLQSLGFNQEKINQLLKIK